MQKSFSTQPGLFVSARDLEHPILHALDDTEALLDGSDIERLLSSMYSSGTDRPSYPLLTLFRGLLLGIWYRLSDVQLAQALYRDVLFRKFCRLELGGNVPEASTLERFRTQPVEHDLWEKLLGEINRQFEAKNIIITQGRINIIDATPIEAGWQVVAARSRRMAFQCIRRLMIKSNAKRIVRLHYQKKTCGVMNVLR